jgi:hypothetical protein
MPCSTWKEVAGKRCSQCNGYATHYYGNTLLCCDCHGGFLVSQREAKRAHETVIMHEDDDFHNNFLKKVKKNN